MVEKSSPNTNLILNCLNAFWTGGLICVIGQFITNSFLNLGCDIDIARTITSVILIFIGILLTGLGVYDEIGKIAGAGSVVPITGFANSVAAPALEFKKEGFIFGVGAKMFIIAGPVIVYSTLTSVIVGIFYYLSK
jgi:stage V sporulation protein AC